jgi:hypothetical protein
MDYCILSINDMIFNNSHCDWLKGIEQRENKCVVDMYEPHIYVS